jgi:hypothetical protein
VGTETCGIKVQDGKHDTEEHTASVEFSVGRWLCFEGKVADGWVGGCEVQVQSVVGHGAFRWEHWQGVHKEAAEAQELLFVGGEREQWGKRKSVETEAERGDGEWIWRAKGV